MSEKVFHLKRVNNLCHCALFGHYFILQASFYESLFQTY